ncbi:MAG: pyridoxal-phosphate dependent enzyme [Candidatus Omnitrophica bacterium]|nr:pyridoxal-phosphate dependent enzyme [Candidatus Omnitrophota bacterium]
MITKQDVLEAEKRIADWVWRTPLVKSEWLSDQMKRPVFLKLENLQRTGAFKIRGVLNKVMSLSEKEIKAGLVCATSGSHGLAVGLAGQIVSSQVLVVVPRFTPEVKIRRLRQRAKVVVFGETYQESYLFAIEEAKKKKMTLIHGFDDPLVIAGQGTVGLEILKTRSSIKTVIVPIGGGGLVAGMLVALKETVPGIRVVGVQAAEAPSMYLSWKERHVVELPRVETIAEGIAVKKPGNLTFEIVQRYIDEIVLVTEEEIKTAVITLLEECRVLAEPAGSVAIAALLSNKVSDRAEEWVGVVTGGNIELAVLAKLRGGTSENQN